MKVELEKTVTLKLINIIMSDQTPQEKVIQYNKFVIMIEGVFEEAKEILKDNLPRFEK